MPGLNGFETAELIKSRERTRYIPIIFLTAISKDESYVFRAYSVGAVDYMSKPFQPDVLRSKVAVFVDLYRKQRQLRTRGVCCEAPSADRARAPLSFFYSRGALAHRKHCGYDCRARAERHIELFNAAAGRMFGRSAADVIGIASTKSSRIETRPRPNDGEQTGPTPASQASVAHRVSIDGEGFPLQVSVSGLDGGRSSYAIIATSPIAFARRRARAQAGRSREPAELRQLNKSCRAAGRVRSGR
jgi:CheY-like chemotaxis protein